MIIRATVTHNGLSFIEAIKMFRILRPLGPKEAKDIVETMPAYEKDHNGHRGSLLEGQSFCAEVDLTHFGWCMLSPHNGEFLYRHCTLTSHTPEKVH